MQLFSVFGEILLKDNGVSSKLDETDKKASKLGGTFDDSFSKIKSAALGLGAALGVTFGFKELIDGAANSQARLSQMDNVLKSTKDASGMTKDELIKLADAQGKVTTFSKGANMETENLLLTFTNIGKKTFPDALKAVNDMSQALGQDTKSSAIQLGKALNDPVKGITALSRVGVSFTQQQKDQIAAMEKSGNTAGAQAIILQELQKEFGGSAEAAGKTFGGQLTILKNNISGVAANLGTSLLPYIQNFITTINNHMPEIKKTISDVIKTVGPYIKDIIKDVVQIAENLLPNFGKSVGDAKGKVMELVKNGLADLKGIFDWMAQHGGLVKGAIVGIISAFTIYHGILLAVNIAQGIHKAAQLIGIALNGTQAATTGAASVALGIHNAAVAASTAAQWLWNAALNANPIGIVILAIGALIAIGVILYKKSATFRNFVNTCWGGLKIFGTWIKTGFISLVGHIADGLISFKDKVASIFSAIGKFFVNLKDGIVSKVKNIGSAIVDGFKNAVSFITGLPGRALEWGKDFINGFINGIKNMIGKVGDAVKGIADKVKSFLHFSKPDEGPLADYETWMPDFMQGMAKGITDNKGKITDAVKGLATDVNVGMKLNTSAVSANKSQTLAVQGSNGTPVQVIFQGNYCFMNKEMIDYFTSKVSNTIALQAARRD